MTGAEWAATLPAKLTAGDALHACDIALGDAAGVVDAVMAQFHGGTLPPAPWPMLPAMEAAARRVHVVRDGIAPMVDRAPTLLLATKTADVVRSAGLELYRASAETADHWASAPRWADLPSLHDVHDLLLLGAVVWWWWQHEHR